MYIAIVVRINMLTTFGETTRKILEYVIKMRVRYDETVRFS